MKTISKHFLTLLCSITWIACLSQGDSSILITDNQAKYFISESLEAQNLRKDTSNYLKVIRDYKSLSKTDSSQINMLIRTSADEQKTIQKLTVANTRWKRATGFSFGLFVVSVSWVVILWHLK